MRNGECGPQQPPNQPTYAKQEESDGPNRQLRTAEGHDITHAAHRLLEIAFEFVRQLVEVPALEGRPRGAGFKYFSELVNEG